jgi:glycine cleavage system H protein
VYKRQENGGWMFKLTLSDPSEVDTLLDADGYAELTL